MDGGPAQGQERAGCGYRVFTSDATGEPLVILSKSINNPCYVGEALENYPNIPVTTMDRVGTCFGDGDVEQASGITYEFLVRVTDEKF